MINETSSNFYDSLNIFPNNVKKIQFWSILCSIKWAKLGRSHGGSRAMMGSQERAVWSLEDTTCIWEGYLHIWWKEYNIYVLYILWLNRITLDFKKKLFFSGCEFVLPRDFIGSKNCRNVNLDWPGWEGDGCEAGSLGNNINPGRGERGVLSTQPCHASQGTRTQQSNQSGSIKIWRLYLTITGVRVGTAQHQAVVSVSGHWPLNAIWGLEDDEEE